MKNYNKPFIYSFILFLALTLSGCELIAGIFEAGVWVGIIIAVLVVFILIFIVIKIFKSLGK
jgi:hypothetical protein